MAAGGNISEKVLPGLTALVLGIILVTIGAAGADITYAIAHRIVTSVAGSGSQTLGALQSMAQNLSSVMTIIGVALVAIGGIFIIDTLIGVFSGMRGSLTSAAEAR